MSEKTERTKLKSCPFCGHPPKIETVPGSQYPGFGFIMRDRYRVHCSYAMCAIQGWTIEYLSKRGAIAAWNRRTAGTKKGNIMKEPDDTTVDFIASAMRCADDTEWTRGDIIRFVINAWELHKEVEKVEGPWPIGSIF